ncbi:hypothetical protein DHEL01_v202383 [Diaporthe helianthi]|uniref:Glycoside hydrolase family 43 protein n=1 Tax=Diaporthe helianthi TaxID=158607 RepID=A0A2P5I9P7_DIAHE|nr:hypothetical protein DHEL01_v202383 [Diaporthe helianthi]
MYFFQSITALLSLFVCLFDFSDAYTNPIRNPGGSDPFLVYTGGYYYLLTTSWNDVQISRATSIDGLKSATKKVVYSSSAASRCCNVWAPEVHYLGGAWYNDAGPDSDHPLIPTTSSFNHLFDLRLLVPPQL